VFPAKCRAGSGYGIAVGGGNFIPHIDAHANTGRYARGR